MEIKNFSIRITRLLIIILIILLCFPLCAKETFYSKLHQCKWVVSEYYEVLRLEDRTALLSLFPNVEDYYYHEHSNGDIHTWGDSAELLLEFFFLLGEDFYVEHVGDFKNENKFVSIGDCHSFNFLIEENQIQKNNKQTIFLCKTKNVFADVTGIFLIDFPKIKKGNEYFLKIIFDGDYFDFYIDDIFIHKFCRINKETLEQYENLIKDGKCDLEKVTWPRHADGTSEFDDKIISPEPIITEEDLENFETEQKLKNAQKEKLIIEETPHIIIYKSVRGLKNGVIQKEAEIFEEPGKFKIITATPGTEVKILKIGKEDTKDNIKSNWIKVKVTKNAKSIIGVDMKGVTGWIFGGYLK